MLEQKVQKKIIDFLNDIGAWSCKIISSNKAGTPDILACHQGKFLAIECKSVKGKPSEIQKYQISQIEQAGGIAVVAYSINDVKRIIHE